jgi:hypothetical protein
MSLRRQIRTSAALSLGSLSDITKTADRTKIETSPSLLHRQHRNTSQPTMNISNLFDVQVLPSARPRLNRPLLTPLPRAGQGRPRHRRRQGHRPHDQRGVRRQRRQGVCVVARRRRLRRRLPRAQRDGPTGG